MVDRPAERQGVLGALQGADFEDYLSSFYLTLVRLGVPTRKALEQEGYHPDDVTRATLELEGRELIQTSGSDSWEVRPPELALPMLAAQMEQRARSTRANATELGVLWRRARAAASAGSAVGGLELLGSVEQIVAAAQSLIAGASQDLRQFHDASPTSVQLLSGPPETAPDGKAAPQSRRVVVDVALLDYPGVLDRVQAEASRGWQVRVADGLPFSGVVADGRMVVVDFTRHDPSGDGSFLSRRNSHVRAAIALSEVAFEMSTPVVPTLAARADGEPYGAPLDSRDTQVLSLLAIGATDQMIARQIGASTRTVERRVRYLMEHLGVATRFQAGVQAARRGWI